MSAYYIVPSWFFGIDIALELLFLIITFAVAIIAYKIYKISKEKSMRLFSSSFLLISLSYLAWAIINSIAISKLNGDLTPFSLREIFLTSSIGLYAHILLLSIGLITLAYAVLPEKDSRVYYLLLGLGLVAIVASTDKIMTFRIVSVFLLSSIVYHFFIQWSEHKNKNLLYSSIAFTLLLLSNLVFVFSESYVMAYVAGHLLELLAYLIVLGILIKVTLVKKNNKK